MAKAIPPCAVELTVSLIGNKWKTLIIRDLLAGTKRYGELKKSIHGISQKVLTENLRALEDDGLVLRTVYPEIPPRVEYTLTDTGRSLRSVIDAMYDWGQQYRQSMYGVHECESMPEKSEQIG